MPGGRRSLDLRVLPGMGHLLFHDHLAQSLPLVVDWLETTLRTAPAPATA